MQYFRYLMAVTKGLIKLLIFFNWAPRNGRFGLLLTFSSNFLKQQPCTRITDMITQDEFASYFINTMPCINLSEHWTTLPPSKSRPLKSHSHGLTRRHKNLMVNRFTSRWNTLFEYFHFCLQKMIFMRQLCRNPQFSGIFISIRHIWSSCWQDKCQIRLSLPVCRI